MKCFALAIFSLLLFFAFLPVQIFAQIGFDFAVDSLGNTSDIFEVSTPELEDVVRLEDRYGRAKAD